MGLDEQKRKTNFYLFCIRRSNQSHQSTEVKNRNPYDCVRLSTDHLWLGSFHVTYDQNCNIDASLTAVSSTSGALLESDKEIGSYDLTAARGSWQSVRHAALKVLWTFIHRRYGPQRPFKTLSVTAYWWTTLRWRYTKEYSVVSDESHDTAWIPFNHSALASSVKVYSR